MLLVAPLAHQWHSRGQPGLHFSLEELRAQLALNAPERQWFVATVLVMVAQRGCGLGVAVQV